MASSVKASLPVIKRLPKYHRHLVNMQQNGQTQVSSSELARVMGTTASQVRQDFNCFGGFGQQGIGYKVDTLIAEISGLLFGDGELLSTILIGCGRLGTVVSQYITNDVSGYQLIGAFDKKESEVGRVMNGLEVRHVSEVADFCRQHHPQVAILCIPRESGRTIATELVGLGVKGFWNFSHYDISVDFPDVTVENVHLGDSLMSLSYRMRNK